jgi:hypothetical protein
MQAMISRTTWVPALGLALAGVLGLDGAASATPMVAVLPSATSVGVGESFSVDLVADLDAAILGWGLDLAVSGPATLDPGPPGIGASWTPLAAPDGDGLAGAAFPVGVQGTGILLATLSFTATAPGTVLLQVEITPGDLTEGFALDPTGFAASPVLGSAEVSVPEPGSSMLVLPALAALRRRRQANRIGCTQ